MAFLKERIDEDAATWRARAEPGGTHWPWLEARMLREVEAKRAIMAEHKPGARFAWNEDEQACQRCGDLVTVQWPCRTIRAFAAVYSDHPDYDPAWNPG